jgi:hypothetical protein
MPLPSFETSESTRPITQRYIPHLNLKQNHQDNMNSRVFEDTVVYLQNLMRESAASGWCAGHVADLHSS